jgi:hypothetical protein
LVGVTMVTKIIVTLPSNTKYALTI